MRILTLLLIFVVLQSSAQVLDNFPQINSGGTVYALVEDSVNNIIYVAGDFTSIGGQSKTKLAAINMFGNTVINAFSPITSMNGKILCMAIYGNWLYIGGDFDQINGNTALPYLQRINLSTGTIDQSWNIGPNNVVHDLLIHGTALYAAGTGNILYHPITSETREGIAKIDANTGQLLPYDPTGNPANALAAGNFDVRKILIDQNHLYAFGNGFSWTADGIIAFDLNTSLTLNTFTPSFTYDAVIDACIVDNEIYLVNSRFWPSAYGLVRIEKSSGNYIGGIAGMGTGVKTISSYANQIFIAGNFTAPNANTSASLAIWNHNTQTFVNWQPNPNCGFGDVASVHVNRNRLYASSNCLNSISGNTRVGIARYCLPPHPTGTIIGSDVSICPNQIGLPFSISDVPYANYYVWNFSGSGITLTGSGASIFLNANNTPTSGTLTVTPYSACLAGIPSSIAINVDPVPHSFAGNDSSLTCTRTTLTLNGQSNTSNTSFQWELPNSTSQNGNSLIITEPGQYTFIVTDLNNGCISEDVCSISLDTTRPTLLLPVGPFDLTCRDTTLFLLGNSSTPNTQLHWRKSTGEYFIDPFLCNTPGNYFLTGTNLINGCKDSLPLTVFQNTTIPDLYFDSHPISSIALDTLTCTKDSLIVTIGSFTANTSYQFQKPDLSFINNDTILVSSPGNYFAIVENTTNGCKNELPFVILQDVSPPIWVIDDTLSMNCISDSILVNASTNTWNEIDFINDLNDTLPNPCYTDTTGWLYVSAINTLNGCKQHDSIYIQRTLEFPISLGSDTVICVDGEICLSPTLLEIHGDESYSWSNGGQNNMQCFSIQKDTTIYVSVNSIGCFGSDTIQINIPAQPIITATGVPSCAEGTAGSIQVQANNGNGPYDFYCIDTDIHESDGNFTFTTSGIYSFILTDAFGCRYFHTDTLSEQENLPEINFLAHSYFGNQDTLVLIVNSAVSADSISWTIEPNPNVISQDDTSIVIAFTGQDSMMVEMYGFYNGCSVSLQRWLIPGNYPNFTLSGLPELTLWPNPNQGEFTVEYTSEIPLDLNYRILKLNGELVVDAFIPQAIQFTRTEHLENEHEQLYVLLISSELFVLRKTILVLGR
jgi:hypothetical protein